MAFLAEGNVNYDVDMPDSDVDGESDGGDDEDKKKQRAADKVAAKEARKTALKQQTARPDRPVHKPHLKAKSVAVKEVEVATVPAVADSGAAASSAQPSV